MGTIKEPYPGPRPFEHSDRDVFFGRTQESNELVSLITAHPVVLLYAQSGAGKTSLVTAGVIPLLLDEEEFDVLPPMRVREQTASRVNRAEIDNIYMFNALSSIAARNGNGDPHVPCTSHMTLSQYLSERKKLLATDAGVPTVIVFDQFEEMFTLYSERWEDRRKFFEQVYEALNRNSLLRVLFSMREDFIAELDPYAALLPEKLRTRFRIERLRKKPALHAVCDPLEAIENGATRFGPGVAEQLVDNLLALNLRTPSGVKRIAGEFVEPLQLQVVCQTLWKNLKRGDSLITSAHLEAFGDVDKALTMFYENAIAKTVDLCDIGEGELREWFDRTLITPHGTRGTVFRGNTESGGIQNQVVDQLENQKIVRVELRGGAQWCELTHDRFIEVIQASNRRWQLSRPVLEQIYRRLEERAREWDENYRPDAKLLDDVELLEAQRLLSRPDAPDPNSNKVLAALLHESREKIESERRKYEEQLRLVEERARMARRFQLFSYSLIIVSLLTVAALAFAIIQYRRARTNAEELDRQRVLAEARATELDRARGKLAQTIAQWRSAAEAIAINSSEAAASDNLNAGKFAEAERDYRQILEAYESDKNYAGVVRTYGNLGQVFHKQGQTAKALEQYRLALKVAATDPNLTNEMAVIYRRRAELFSDLGERKEKNNQVVDAIGRYKDAIDSYQRAVVLFNKKKNVLGAAEASEQIVKLKRHIEDLRAMQGF